MAHGIQHNARHGDVHGIRHGSLTLGEFVGVSKDAASGKYVPANSTEWNILLTGSGILSGGPSAVYGFQDASGSITDSVGAFPLTVSGTAPLYQQGLPGVTRKAFLVVEGLPTLIQSLSASLPDISTTSFTLMSYTAVLGPASATSTIQGLGASGTPAIAQTVGVTGLARAVSGANSLNGVNNIADSTLRMLMLQVNRTAGTCTLYTNTEQLVPTFSGSMAGKSLSFGNFVSGNPSAGFAYAAAFFGASAEFTTNQSRTLFQSLGWSVPW